MKRSSDYIDNNLPHKFSSEDTAAFIEIFRTKKRRLCTIGLPLTSSVVFFGVLILFGVLDISGLLPDPTLLTIIHGFLVLIVTGMALAMLFGLLLLRRINQILAQLNSF